MKPAALPRPEQWLRWGVQPDWSRTIDVAARDGGVHRWHLLERGPVAPIGTIVCVHGNPTWSYLWRSLLERLGDRYRVIAVDQLGMGFSDRIGRRRFADRVRDLDDVISALDIEGPLIVAGHDWGGAVAMGWAVRGDPRLAGLVLCNTGIAVPAGRRAPGLIRLAASGPLTDLVCHRSNVFVEGTVRLSRGRISAVARQAYRAPYRGAQRRGAIADFVADVPFTTAHPSAGALAAVAAQLPQLRVPVLLAWGAADPVFDDSFAADLAARMPHADQQRFAACGHLSVEEADAAGAVQRWLLDRFEHDTAPLPAAPWAASPWQALERRADDDAVAFVDGNTGESTSFRQLHARVMGIARGLNEQGLQPNDRVAVLVPPGVELIAVVYALWRAGAVTVIADRGLGMRGLGRAVRAAHVSWVIGPPPALAVAGALRWAPRARRVVAGARPAGTSMMTLDDLAASTAALAPEPGQHANAAVLYTSGATGPAKGVRYTHGQLCAQRDALARAYAIVPGDRLVAAFAPFALYGPALGIASAIPAVDVTKPGTLTAAALSAACAGVGATIVFASPAALANVVRTAAGTHAPVLAELRLVLSAGAPVPVTTLRAMAELAPRAALHTPYGMTECLPVADVSLAGIDAAGTGRGVCVGTPVAPAEVMIAPLHFDPDLPVGSSSTGATGEVLVRAPWLSAGYDRLWATEHDARPSDETGGRWHRSGDVGHFDSLGRLWIEGRSVHVISTATGPVTPVPVEVATEAVIAGRAAAVGVGPPGCQQVVVVVEAAGVPEGLAAPAIVEPVRAAVTAQCGVSVAAVLTVHALPVDIRHNTKIDRTTVAGWATTVLRGANQRRPW